MIKFNNTNINHVYFSRLPREYQEVEWIDTDGNSYIETSVYVDSISCRVKALSSKNQVFVSFGRSCYIGSSPNGSYFNYAIMTQTTTLPAFERIFDILDIYINNNYIIQNNIKYVYNTPQAIREGYLNTYLPEYTPEARYYNVKGYRNNVLVINLVPCYRKSDNVAGMYDLVNGLFYTNQGTGTFTVGNKSGIKPDHIYYNGTLVYEESPTPATMLSYPHSIGTLSRMTQTGTMTFDRYNISSSPVRFTQNDEDDRRGSAVVNFQTVTPSGTLTSAKLYMYGNGSGNGFLEVDIGNIYVGDFILDTTPQERIINLPTDINPNEPITLTLDEANEFYVDINAMKLELNYDGGRQLMGVKRTTKTQERSYHRYEKLLMEDTNV